MTPARGVRERARHETIAAIKREARHQLALEGAAKLSLRAVARELGLVSSALYRYFPSRDELLTALIVDAYDAVGEVAEARLAATEGEHVSARWLAVARGVRHWAAAHPHEYALLYGTPVPGYRAPQETTRAASRIPLALLAVVTEAHTAGVLRLPGPVSPAAAREGEAVAARLGLDLPGDAMARAAQAWGQLFGLLSFELFGQYTGSFERSDAFFDDAAAELGRLVGLPAPEGEGPR
ncbi:TetR/AcrR family transcriptional regulator [Streptomyces sp. NPDC059740]|uniref:TetR/AcrR family transcriptional regulator n=1 Tax=Streptomyces sp. NPDC059740 TaxID=3346926 RepID=UPI00365C53AE